MTGSVKNESAWRSGGARPRRRAAGLIAAACGLALAARLPAQVTVTLALDPPVAVTYEHVDAKVTVANESGRLLRLGADADSPARLLLEVRRDGDRQIARRADAPALLAAAELVPGEQRTVSVPLERHFVLERAGRYWVRASVAIGETVYAAAPADLEVAAGSEMLRLTAGVPGEAGGQRTYVLTVLQRAGGEVLFLRIEDVDGRWLYGLHPLGRIVRVRPPDLRVDGSGNAHVLFQTIGMAYVHAAFTPMGVPLFRRLLTGTRGKARLELQAGGRIAVPDGTPLAAPTAADTNDQELLERGRKKVGGGGLLGRFQRTPNAPAAPAP